MLVLSTALAASVTVKPGDDLQALASSLGPGDVMAFQDGVYELESQLSIRATGEEGSPVHIRPQAGATPILKMIGTSTVFELRESAHVVVRGLIFEGPDGWESEGNRGVTLRDVAHVVFEDNEVRNTRYSLLVVEGDADGVELRRNHLHHTAEGHGIYAGCGDGSCWSLDGVFEQNHIHDIGLTDGRYGIILENGGQGNRVADNVIYRTGHGIRVESTQLGAPNHVLGNAIWDGLNDGIQVLGAARVRNNVVFQMLGVGIYSTNHENNDLGDVVISYNTVAHTDSWGVRVNGWSERDSMVLSSNVVANITGRGLRYDADEVEENPNYITRNVVSGLVEGVDLTLNPDWLRPGSGVADFIDVEAWDFYPVPNSGLIGAGDPAGDAWVPEQDFNGAPRNGAGPTAGAYEWSGNGPNPGWPLAEDFKELGALNLDGRTDLERAGCCKRGNPTEAVLLLPLLGLGLGRRRRPGAR